MLLRKNITNNNQKYPEHPIFYLTGASRSSRRFIVSILTYDFFFKKLRPKDREDLGEGSQGRGMAHIKGEEKNGQKRRIQVCSYE